MRTNTGRTLRATALAMLLAIPGMALAGSLDELPRETLAAMKYFESDPDLWAEGPVRYILLDGEREMLKDLETREERAAFMQWFWDRRDTDLRDGVNEARIGFYERVAEANRKYNDFPRGWKSTRGEIHIVLGRPDSVRPSMGARTEATVWTYYTVGPAALNTSFGSVGGEVAIAFVKDHHRSRYQIYGGFGGPGTLPLYVRDALAYSKLAAIVDPSLKGNFGG
ncbi:MAG: GWxTD domain-containing protein [Acidobacteria bacterium]|nr:GWxTD domain-containing protein [Acidobacteriota bacterium]